MKNRIHILLVAMVYSFAALTTSCSTDFDLNAPYDATPVIFASLDQSVDTQFVKINKSFIGNGNNEDYAAINDSSLYTNVVGRVEEYVNDAFVQSFTLQEMWVGNLDAGLFYTDSQKVFFFVPPSGLDESAIYKLVVDVDEESSPITAETELIKGSSLNFDNLFTQGAINPQIGIQFADASSLANNDYLSINPSWKSVLNGKRYELKIRMNYMEVTATGSKANYIDWNLLTDESESLAGGESMNKPVKGLTFFETIDNKLKGYAFEADVTRRIIMSIDFTVTVANDNLNTFIEVNEPSTGVVTERPTYSNINGGVGLFGSKYSITLSSNLNSHSAKVLCDGPITSAYKFCVDPSITPFGPDILSVTNYPEIGCP